MCTECGYKSNVESAESIIRNKGEEFEELRLVYTPDIHTIDEVCVFLNSSQEKSCKAVVYQKCSDDSPVVLFIRGDLEVNETKVKNWLMDEIRPADLTEGSGLHPGYIGPYNLDGDFTVLFDGSLEGACNLSCGGNVEEHHYTGLCMERDCSGAEYHDFAKIKEDGIRLRGASR